MQYIRFNCYDLSIQSTELYDIYRRIQTLADEFAGILNVLDPQIKSYENLQQKLSEAQNATAGISACVLKAYHALEQIIDIYYAADNKVKQSVEELPVDAVRAEGHSTGIDTGMIQTASINRGDLVLEDWLAELLYKNGINDGE